MYPSHSTPAAPAFSIIIPTYNRSTTLVRAVQSCLQQSFTDFELIVVDDGSSTPAATVLTDIDDSRLHIIRSPLNHGVSNARNLGLSQAAGQYIAFLDSDDAFTIDKLEICHRALSDFGYPDDLCMSSRIFIRRASGFKTAIPGSLIESGESLFRYLFVRGGILSTDTLVISASLARKARFRTDLTRHEDYDYMGQLEMLGARFAMLPDTLAIWYDEDQPDRLTRSTGFTQSNYWVNSMAGKLDADVHAACQLRIVGPLAARERWLGGLPIYLRYIRAASSMKLQSKMVCFLKCTAPGVYTRLTSLYVKATGTVA